MAALLLYSLLACTTSSLTAAAAGGEAPPMALPLPPMGWMSWLRFLCNTDCAAQPKACINADLYRSTADALVAGGFADAGYAGVHIDDCWAAKQRDQATKQMLPDPVRFPGPGGSGVKLLGDYLAARNLTLGLYSDQGVRTCGGYPGRYAFPNLRQPSHSHLTY